MPRKEMVTRAFNGTEAEVFTVNVKTEEGKPQTVRVLKRYKTSENLLKAIQKQYDTEDVKFMKVISFKPFKKLYGMPVKQFYENSIELDTVTRKPVEKEGK